MRKTKNPLYPIMLIAIAMMAAPLTGCSDDERLVSLSQESANRQAEQNRQIVRQSEQVAEATHDLVRQDAAARTELIAAQKTLETSLQSERASLDRQRVALAEERRDLAAARDRAPIIAAAITAAAWLLPLALLFALCLYLARNLGASEPSESLEEFLVAELLAEKPMLSSRPRIGIDRPALDSPEIPGAE